jgi:hypothetical protein
LTGGKPHNDVPCLPCTSHDASIRQPLVVWGTIDRGARAGNVVGATPSLSPAAASDTAAFALPFVA